MSNDVMTEYTQELSILYAEDDQVSSALIELMLRPHFKIIYAAKNGIEGLELFRTHNPDVVITDLMMPLMDGIEMLAKIREIDHKTPVILMTASLEHVHLVQAINLGVSKFLAKPILKEALNSALFAVIRELALERITEKARENEIELLRLRNRYHIRQEEMAQRKETHIVRNWLEGHYISAPGQGSWIVDTVYHPKDVMSGDSFSIKRHPDGTLLIFLADAMGHGLSASVTSMLATSFYNHATSGCACSPLPFNQIAQRTMLYIGRNLLDDEVFSCTILQIDPVNQIARFSSCGMPPLRVVRNGEVESIKGANPPICDFTDSVTLQEFSLAGVSDILMSTDGLGDTQMANGSPYSHQLADDLLASSTANDLFTLFQEKGCEEYDDITIIRLVSSAETHTNSCSVYRLPATHSGIEELQQELIRYFDESGVQGDKRYLLELAITEVLQNAFEHGCLKLGMKKQQLLLNGEYDDLITQAEKEHHELIEVYVTITPKNKGMQILVETIDPGEGFPSDKKQHRDPSAPCGRGLALIKRSVDKVWHNESGNRILLLQTIPEEMI